MASPAKDDLVFKALFAGGNAIQVEAQISITEGAVSGKNHVPAPPGQPPNNDTGELANSIETTGDRAAQKVFVTVNAAHGIYQELGTSKMAARPYMVPAVERTRQEVTELVAKAVSRSVKGR